MLEPIHNKALFRFTFAFSGNQPVDVFDLVEDHLRPRTLTACKNDGVSLEVAVAKHEFEPNLDGDGWPEPLATAYEEFVSDPGSSEEHLHWIKL